MNFFKILATSSYAKHSSGIAPQRFCIINDIETYIQLNNINKSLKKILSDLKSKKDDKETIHKLLSLLSDHLSPIIESKKNSILSVQTHIILLKIIGNLAKAGSKISKISPSEEKGIALKLLNNIFDKVSDTAKKIRLKNHPFPSLLIITPHEEEILQNILTSYSSLLKDHPIHSTLFVEKTSNRGGAVEGHLLKTKPSGPISKLIDDFLEEASKESLNSKKLETYLEELLSLTLSFTSHSENQLLKELTNPEKTDWKKIVDIFGKFVELRDRIPAIMVDLSNKLNIAEIPDTTFYKLRSTLSLLHSAINGISAYEKDIKTQYINNASKKLLETFNNWLNPTDVPSPDYIQRLLQINSFKELYKMSEEIMVGNRLNRYFIKETANDLMTKLLTSSDPLSVVSYSKNGANAIQNCKFQIKIIHNEVFLSLEFQFVSGQRISLLMSKNMTTPTAESEAPSLHTEMAACSGRGDATQVYSEFPVITPLLAAASHDEPGAARRVPSPTSQQKQIFDSINEIAGQTLPDNFLEVALPFVNSCRTQETLRDLINKIDCNVKYDTSGYVLATLRDAAAQKLDTLK